jgi:hypothetical protein
MVLGARGVAAETGREEVELSAAVGRRAGESSQRAGPTISVAEAAYRVVAHHLRASSRSADCYAGAGNRSPVRPSALFGRCLASAETLPAHARHEGRIPVPNLA